MTLSDRTYFGEPVPRRGVRAFPDHPAIPLQSHLVGWRAKFKPGSDVGVAWPKAFPYVYRGRYPEPDARKVDTVDEKRRVGGFLNFFGEEIEIVRAARNAVAHAQPLSDDELRKAIDICRRPRDMALQVRDE